MNFPLMLPAEERAPALNVGGFQITVLASTEQTGDYELFHIRGPEGTGPGPHHHPWSESFYVLSGAVRCGVGEDETLATAGTLIHVPGNTSHWFKFEPGGGEFFSMTSRGNAAAMFAAFDKGVNWENPDREALIALAGSYGQVVAR
jgi:quercetin dioxygenase-like cupin family protein